MDGCKLCPRMCGANRAGGGRGVCGADDKLKIARAALHFWEEPCISGTRGSGAVFFSGCPLMCEYCQNRDISHGGRGLEISVSRLAEIFFELRGRGAHNINLVTPTHYKDLVCAAVDTAKKNGFDLPFVYNTSGYERPEIIRTLNGYIDIFLTDFKYMSRQRAGKYSHAEDYPDFAKSSLAEMMKISPRCTFNSDGIMMSGVIVRHLVLPNGCADSKDIIAYLCETYGSEIYLSLMNQYTPCGDFSKFPELMNTVSEKEYDEVTNFALMLGMKNCFVQCGGTVSESFIPPFDFESVLRDSEK